MMKEVLEAIGEYTECEMGRINDFRGVVDTAVNLLDDDEIETARNLLFALSDAMAKHEEELSKAALDAESEL